LIPSELFVERTGLRAKGDRLGRLVNRVGAEVADRTSHWGFGFLWFGVDDYWTATTLTGTLSEYRPFIRPQPCRDDRHLLPEVRERVNGAVAPADGETVGKHYGVYGPGACRADTIDLKPQFL
jgi:hypothetical protein